MTEPGERLDMALVSRGLAPSRARAQALLRERKVSVNGEAVSKAARMVAPSDDVSLSAPDHPWVSRAALKLVHGLAHFGIKPEGLRALDLGASTGGFTQVLRAHGAAHVIAVDVGHGQFAGSLREDDGISVLEGTNARDLSVEMTGGAVDLIVCDVSFISLEKALPAALALAKPGAFLLTLIKPQFEVGKGRLGKGGIVKDAGLHEEVCVRLETWLAAQPGWRVLGLCPSPITGSDGNKEFLMAGRFDG